MASLQRRSVRIGPSDVFAISVYDPAYRLPPYEYSVGFNAANRPECCVVGLDWNQSHAILELCVAAFTDGRRFAHDEIVTDFTERRVPLRVWRLNPTCYARFFPEIVQQPGMHEVVQLFWPDPSGAWPDMATFDARFQWQQPVLDRIWTLDTTHLQGVVE